MIPPQASLGGVIFGLSGSGIDTVERMLPLKWPSIDRVQNRPKKQFTGIGDEQITIQGNYFPDVHGENVVPRLRAIALKGDPVVFTMGSGGGGTNLGMWCIVDVKNTNSFIMGGGLARKIEFTVTIEFFSTK